MASRILFICSKPLQFLICTTIARTHKLENCEIAITSSGISDFENFIRSIKSSQYADLFKKIHTIKKHSDTTEILELHSFDEYFLEDDRTSFINIIKSLRTHNKNARFNVFEEGFGTYLSDYPFTFTTLKKIKWNAHSFLWGSTLHFGGCKLTQHIYLQHPEIYKTLNPGIGNKAVYSGRLIDTITSQIEFWKNNIDVSLPKLKGKKVAIILGTWGGVKNDLSHINQEKYDTIIYKAHPHTGKQNLPNLEGVVITQNPWLPAEALILLIKNASAATDVYHHSSSSAFYLNDESDIKFYDLMKDKRFQIVNSKRTHESKYNFT